MNPLDRLSSFYYRSPVLSWLSRLSKPGLRWALAVVVAIVLLLLLLWIAIGVLPLLPLRFRKLAGPCAIAAEGIGRASGRDRVWSLVWDTVVAVTLKKYNHD